MEEVAYYLGHVTQKGIPAVQTTRRRCKSNLALLSHLALWLWAFENHSDRSKLNPPHSGCHDGIRRD